MEQCLIMYIVILYVIISFLGFGGGKLFIWVIRNPARPQTQHAAKDDLEFIIFLPPPSHNLRLQVWANHTQFRKYWSGSQSFLHARQALY